MSNEEIEAAKKILRDNGVKLYPSAWDASVAKYGLEKAREIARSNRAKVNPKNIKGRPKKLGSNAEG